MNRQYFQEQLDQLMRDTLVLGDKVVDALVRALAALQTNNVEQMSAVIDNDQQINAVVEELHHRCLTMIARQQPMARDLREISVVLSLLPELERIADHAASCCKIMRRMQTMPGFVPLGSMIGSFPTLLSEMGNLTLQLLQHGLDALARRDAAYAEQLCQEDDAIDHLYKALFAETIAVARSQPDYSDEAIHLLTLAHNLERIGDRVTNLAEQVIFLLRGEVVELNT
jgi:phosphate transport system protein